jgi:small conductance mechanosensitive channel
LTPAWQGAWQNLWDFWRDSRQDLHQFLHHDLPKILLVVLGTFLLIRLLRLVTARMGALKTLTDHTDLRAQQLKTLAGVINSVGMFAILFVALLQIVSQLGFNLGPLLASAGIVGLAIGFGAQTLVKDVLNGFFILLENHYDLGDTVRMAGVTGTVEQMTLRRTVLRDENGSVHTIPNSEIKLVSNMTRDWAQILQRVTVSYAENSERVVAVLQQVCEQMNADPQRSLAILAPLRVLGIDRVGTGEVDYLIDGRTWPGQQYEIARELRRRIKQALEENKVQPGPVARVYVVDEGAGRAR